MQRAFRATGVVTLLFFFGLAVPLDGARRVWFVPWKVLERGQTRGESLFALYWIPAAPEDLRRSSLVTSKALAVYSTRCVGMYVVRADDVERLERFRTPELPVAILVDGDREIARVSGQGGALRAQAVEAMVRAAFEASEQSCEEALDEARQMLRNGEKEGAAAIYRDLVLRRCAFPRQAREAQRALNRMR